ncbi:MAG: hypothetical protein ACLPTM_16680 [Steroidobacteraceae bacterium]
MYSKPWVEFFGFDRPPVRVLIMLCEVYAARSDWDHGPVRTLKAFLADTRPASRRRK